MQEPYTREELKRAYDFIEERLMLQRGISSEVKELMYLAALSIAKIAAKYNIEPQSFKFVLNSALNKEVDKVIAQLVKKIIDAICTLAAYDTNEKEKSRTLIYVKQNTYGSNIEQRVRAYAKQYKTEVEIALAASLFFGKKPQETANIIKSNITALHGSKLFETARKENFSAISNYDTKVKNGFYRSSYNNIDRAVTDIIARSRQQLFYEREKAAMWYVMRGSSYPCDLCDSQVGLHSSASDLPPYHPHCVCIAIPIKTSRNEQI